MPRWALSSGALKYPTLRNRLEAQPEMKTLMCDGCGVPIQDGEKAVAITQWLGGGMGPWENEYQQE